MQSSILPVAPFVFLVLSLNRPVAYTRLDVDQTGLCEIVLLPKISIGSARLFYKTAGLLYLPGRLANPADLGNRSEQMYIEPQLKWII